MVLIYQVKYLYIRKRNPLTQYYTNMYQQGPGLLGPNSTFKHCPLYPHSLVFSKYRKQYYVKQRHYIIYYYHYFTRNSLNEEDKM